MLFWTLVQAVVSGLLVVVGMDVVVRMFVDDRTEGVLVEVKTGKLLDMPQFKSSYKSISSFWSVETVTRVLSSTLVGVYRGL